MMLNRLTTTPLYFFAPFFHYMLMKLNPLMYNSVAGPRHDIDISSSLVGTIIPFLSYFIFRSRMR